MSSPLYNAITNNTMANYNSNISHQIIKYVDGSANIIYTDNNNELQKYFNNYFKEIKGIIILISF